MLTGSLRFPDRGVTTLGLDRLTHILSGRQGQAGISVVRCSCSGCLLKGPILLK
jgi:hypothetical protein